jgi:hypothetical protein
MQRITKGGWTYRVEQPYYQQCASALKKLAQNVEDNARSFVRHGPKLPDQSEIDAKQNLINALANELRDLAAVVPYGQTSYEKFDAILHKLHALGVFPDDGLVSEVARAFVMAEMDNIHPSEAEDFVNEIKRRRRSLDEFEVTATPQQLTGPGISPYRGTITIRNRKSGSERTYATGHGSMWVVEFIRDLEAGVF